MFFLHRCAQAHGRAIDPLHIIAPVAIGFASRKSKASRDISRCGASPVLEVWIGILLILASIAGIFISLPFIGWPSLAVGTGMFILAGMIRPKDADDA